MNDQERIDYLILALASGNEKAFAQNCGIHPASLSKLRNGKFHLPRFTGRILRAYPQINPDWLLYGQGEPMKKRLSEREISARLDDLEKKVDRLLVLMEKVSKIG